MSDMSHLRFYIISRQDAKVVQDYLDAP